MDVGEQTVVAPTGPMCQALGVEIGFAAQIMRLNTSEPGRLLNTWHHPDHPGYSVQMVSGALFDRRCDADRLRVVYLDPEARIILPPVEDLIADRLGQYCSVPANPDPSTLEQANLLLDLAPDIDWAYLERRVQEDQGDISLLTAARSERRLK